MSEKDFVTSVDSNSMVTNEASSSNANNSTVTYEASNDNNSTVTYEATSSNDNDSSEVKNKARISGTIEDEFKLSHESHGEKFYEARVRVTRTSGTDDLVPIVASRALLVNILKSSNKVKGRYVEVGGEFRSYTIPSRDRRKHLKLFLFATDIIFYENEEEFKGKAGKNWIYLNGLIARTPVFRVTPFGSTITDLMIAVERNFGKSDLIPCIAWEDVAWYAKGLEEGNQVRIYGRIQSRQYFKRNSPGSQDGENRITYEISIMRMVKVE